jgi:hypothetical protein
MGSPILLVLFYFDHVHGICTNPETPHPIPPAKRFLKTGEFLLPLLLLLLLLSDAVAVAVSFLAVLVDAPVDALILGFFVFCFAGTTGKG